MWGKWKLGLPTKAEKTFPSFQKVEVVIMDMIASIFLLFAFQKKDYKRTNKRKNPKDKTKHSEDSLLGGMEQPSLQLISMDYNSRMSPHLSDPNSQKICGAPEWGPIHYKSREIFPYKVSNPYSSKLVI